MDLCGKLSILVILDYLRDQNLLILIFKAYYLRRWEDPFLDISGFAGNGREG